MIRYVVWCPGNREGEFEFLCATQKNWTTKKKEALDEAEDRVRETMLMCNPPMTRTEAVEELGGPPVVYKLTIERVK